MSRSTMNVDGEHMFAVGRFICLAPVSCFHSTGARSRRSSFVIATRQNSAGLYERGRYVIVACSQVAGPGITSNCQVFASAITESSNAGSMEPRVTRGLLPLDVRGRRGGARAEAGQEGQGREDGLHLGGALSMRRAREMAAGSHGNGLKSFATLLDRDIPCVRSQGVARPGMASRQDRLTGRPPGGFLHALPDHPYV